MNLPTLPPVLCHAGDSDCYTPDQMTEYGKECRAAEIDEITRLRALIKKAQSESELIEYKGKAAIVVPYSFMRAATEMPEQAQAVEPVGYWLERAKELVEIFVEKPRDTSPPAQQVAVPAGYALVPVEPTDAIIDAMDDVISLAYNQSNARQKYKAKHTYKAMLAAAPQPPQGDTP